MSELAGNSGKQTKREPGMMAALARYFARFDDGEVLRWAFRGLLVGTIGVLGMDYYEMYLQTPPETVRQQTPQLLTPLLPPIADPTDGGDPRTRFTGDQAILRQPMSFTLAAGGVLEATGTIDQGASQRLAEELASRGEYVKMVSLNSPGGSVQDAMAMGKLLREQKKSTEVIDGALCASSCPLLFAGGEQRLAGAQAAIGVHQFYAVTGGTSPRAPGPAEAMSDAQMTTARISRYLDELGIDPALWLHAMDTPPQSLYYLSADELKKYKLATGTPASAG
jgi:hypothetical protein